MDAAASKEPSENRTKLALALAEVAHGNRSSLKTVYDLTSAKLFGVIVRIERDRESAEDVLQDVYVKVWRRAGRFDPDRASPITWLCAIARNAAIDSRRRTGRETPMDEDALPEIEDDAALADEVLCDLEDADRVQQCLEGLQTDHRRSIRLAFFDGLSHSELAERVGVPLGTMKSWIRRGLASLKGCLGG
ncbi:sigma-70 family RNA polymerase sigma factor [Croceicoccus naphthovorans]|uniref:RNA polymerase sigma factor n=1 Tax=Croceicoccus naphthovorans TaxID=1348774 RepID=A0A0G3XHF9_9SPHN|nr:sigma-70 family RNA polymerase sigma factor [Croceicoccus naphthovorans]AKM10031.1 RNA polymerase sigma factor [Croceicoccus naphthovorans]MBB3991083.1 RNA polymerase sigma-70 factor (ECF subfamily) [Croceicoccus naphthovorans]